MNESSLPRLMLVTNRHLSNLSLGQMVAEAVAGGVGIVQIREKDLDESALGNVVAQVAGIIADKARTVVNGSVQTAIDYGIGLQAPDAMSLPKDIRTLLTPGQLLGKSVHRNTTLSQAASFDYLVAGHVFETASKSGQTPLGLEGLHAIAAVSHSPVFAIGGITPENVSEVISAGAYGIAIMSGIAGSNNPREAACNYRIALEEAMSTDSSDQNVFEIQVNGKMATVPPRTTLSAFLASRDLHERLVVIERNGEILRYPQYPDTYIEAGDVLEIVHFVGGG